MVQAMINISKESNQVLNMVKAKYNLKDKSQAIDRVVLDYAKKVMEPELLPEFVERINKRQQESTVKIEDFNKHFGV